MAKRSRKKRTSLRVGVGGVPLRVAGGIRAMERVADEGGGRTDVPVGRAEAVGWVAAVSGVVTSLVVLVCLYVGGVSAAAVERLMAAEDWLAGTAGLSSLPDGYVGYVAGVYDVVGPLGAPYVLQWLGAVAWAVLLLAVWRLALLLGAGRWGALALVAITGLMPASVGHALAGTADVYVAAGLMVWLAYALQVGWFDRPLAWWREGVLALAAAALVLLEPAGLPVAAVVLPARAYMVRGYAVWGRCAAGCGVLLMVAAVGLWPKLDGFAGWAAGVNVQLPGRWLAYLPWAVLLVLGVRGLVKLPWSFGRDAWIALAHRRLAWTALWALAMMTAMAFAMPAGPAYVWTGLAYWPLVVLVAWVGMGPMLKRLWWEGRHGRMWLAAMALAVLASYAADARMAALRADRVPLRSVALAPVLRKPVTDDWLARHPHQLFSGPHFQRYWLDARAWTPTR